MPLTVSNPALQCLETPFTGLAHCMAYYSVLLYHGHVTLCAVSLLLQILDNSTAGLVDFCNSSSY